jgi:hypothetical protein
MNYSNELYAWMQNVLFIIGILLLPVGVAFSFIPGKMFNLANKMNKWVATDHFFNEINKPRYKESFFYRHHRVFGAVIVLISIASLYSLTLYIGVGSISQVLIRLAESEFEKWLFIILYYILIVAIVLAAIFGIFMFIRPSALKTFEKWSNHWIDTDGLLKTLDRQNNVPDKILPGNHPRIFGGIVMLAAIYIIWRTCPLSL